MVHFVNIRGTNGSGKTTLAQAFVRTPVEVFSSYEYKGKTFKGEAHIDRESGVAVLGKYVEGQCGGCDKIKSTESVRQLLWDLAALEDLRVIVYEGLLVSGLYGKFKEFDAELRQAGHDHTWAFLRPSVQTCYDRVIQRRGHATEKLWGNVESKWRAVESVYKKATDDKLKVVNLPTEFTVGMDRSSAEHYLRHYLGLV